MNMLDWAIREVELACKREKPSVLIDADEKPILYEGELE